jgi:hypothetical protein
VTRKCGTCQHIKRAEIDRRLAAGEPGSQIARDYHLHPSSLHRHRVNCVGLSSSNAIMKEVARGTAAVACLPSKDELNDAYFELRARIDQIVSQAEQQGSLAIAIAGLNSIRHTLDSLMRLAGYNRPIGSVNVAVQGTLTCQMVEKKYAFVFRMRRTAIYGGHIVRGADRSALWRLRARVLGWSRHETWQRASGTEQCG